jgi:hypothetical protein
VEDSGAREGKLGNENSKPGDRKPSEGRVSRGFISWLLGVLVTLLCCWMAEVLMECALFASAVASLCRSLVL